MSKKNFDSEFNRICEDKRRQKEYKKCIFNENIQSHIVYMDEYGNVTKKQKDLSINTDKKNKQQSKKIKKAKKTNKFLYFFIILFLIAFIICMFYELYESYFMFFIEL